MSVTNNKTLAKVRTFAQDFNDHQKATNPPVEPETTEEKKSSERGPLKKVPAVTIQKKEATKIVEREEIAVKKAESHSPKKSSFDNLQKSVNTDLEPEDKKIKPHAPTPRIIVRKKTTPTKKQPNRDVDAMVITATKKAPVTKSQSNVFVSISNWVSNLIKSFSKKENPKYTVQDTTRRKGVIQKASTKSGAIFTADNETLRDQILRRREQQDHQPDVSWSPYTDPGYHLLESGQPKTSVEITYKRQPLPEPVIVEPLRTEPIVSGYDNFEEPEPVLETFDEAPTIEEVPYSEPEPVPEPIPPVIEPAPESILPEPEPPVVEPEPVVPTETPNRPKEKYSPLRNFRALFPKLSSIEMNTNAVAITILALIVSVVLFIIVGRSLLSFMLTDSVVAPRTPVAPLATNQPALELPLSNLSTVSLLTAITQADALAIYPEQEISFVAPEGERLSPQTTLELLDLRINPNLKQTITALHLIVIDNVQHALVFTVDDSITALGGMLEWEQYIEEDLQSVLNSKSVPEDSKRFVDKTFGNLDARVLTDDTDEVLVYGFINENTIVIAKTTDSFVRLAE